MKFQNHATALDSESTQDNSAPFSLSDVQSPQGQRKLLPLGDDEIPVSGRGLSPHFIGRQEELRKQLQALLNADPRKAVLFQMDCAIGDEMLTFFRRQSGKHAVWALPLADKPRLAKAMGWAEKIELVHLQESEIAISGPGLSPHFIGDEKNFAKRLQGLLIADPERTAQQQMECIIGGELFTFSRRQTGQRIIWTLPLADKSRLARAMHATERCAEKINSGRLQENEIAISKSGISAHFIGDADNLTKRLQELLVAHPEKTALHQVECTVSDETFTFSRRLSGMRHVWTLPLADKQRLAAAMGWLERINLDQLHFDEIAVSRSGLTLHFVGRSRNLWIQVEKFLQADPGKIGIPHIEVAIGEEIFTFLRRQCGMHFVWALPLADKSRLARAIGWTEKEKMELAQLQNNEFPISKLGLSIHFIGDTGTLKRQVRSLLGADLENCTLPRLECTIRGEAFTFSRRLTGSNPVWALPLAEKARLAKAMNWEIKKEKKPSTGVAALATFLSAVETHNAGSSKQPGSATQK